MQRTRLYVNYAAAISIPVLVAAVLSVVLSMGRISDSWQWVVHTREVLERLQGTLTLVSRATAIERSLLLQPRPQVQDEFAGVVTAIPREVAGLRQLTSDNPVQQRALEVFEVQLDGYLRALRDGIAQHTDDYQTVHALQLAILAQSAALRGEEERLLVLRQAAVGRNRTYLFVSMGALTVLAVALLLFMRAMAQRDNRLIMDEQSRLKQSQRELSEANQLLERRVDERTEALAEANVELRAFAHTVAHDLRAPLRNVLGYASALREDETRHMSAQGLQFVERIGTVAQRMDRLITDLLQFSQLSRADIQLQAIDLDRVVRLALDNVEGQVRAAGAQLSVGPLPAVRGNEALLVQVFDNLVSNAVKFVAPGVTPQVRIAAETADGVVVVRVSDNGIGIPAAQRERVFDAFERLYGEETYPGSGIGLAIVRKAMERNGGQVTVDSTAAGSCFILTLQAA